MRHFRLGSTPTSKSVVDRLQEALQEEYPLRHKDYEIKGEEMTGADFVRISFLNRGTRTKEFADIRYGTQVGKMWQSMNLVFHGGSSEAPIGGQVDPVIGPAGQVTSNLISPARVLARGFVESTSQSGTRQKSLTQVLSEGVPGHIASFADEESLGGRPVAGKLMGITTYTGSSLQRQIGSAVSISMPAGREQQTLVANALREEVTTGSNIGAGLPGYSYRGGQVPRLVMGAFDVRDKIIDQEGGINYIERTSFQSIGLKTDPITGAVTASPKEVKHGQAGIGARREEALPLDAQGKPVQPGKFGMNLTQDAQGTYDPGGFQYVRMRSRMPWQTGSEPMNRVMAGLTLIPSAIPFGSGQAQTEMGDFPGIAGFGIPQDKSIALSNVGSMDALRTLDFGGIDLAGIGGRTVTAGLGNVSLGTVGEQDIVLPRAARDLNLQGASLSIAPWYVPGKEGGRFAQMREEGAISTSRMAAKLSKQIGVDVHTYGKTTPELQFDYTSDTGGSLKGIGLKTGMTPNVGEMMSVALGSGERVRANQMTSEVKSVPMMFGSSYSMQTMQNQAAILGRLPGVGQQLSDWRLEQGSAAGIDEAAEEYSRITGKQSNWLELSTNLVNTFVGASDKMETLEQFGMAHVQKPQWLMGEMVSKSEMIERQAADKAAVQGALAEGQTIRAGDKTFTGESQAAAAEKALFRYTKTDTGYQSEFFSNEAFVMATGTNIAPEMTGYGTLNYRQISTLTKRFPEAASMMGLTTSSSPMQNTTDPSKVAWAQIKKWETYDLDARRGGFTAPAASDVSNISATDAERIYAATYGGGESFKGMTDKGKMQHIQGAMSGVLGKGFSPSNMMYFSNAMGFLPGSQTMQDIDIFDQVTGESGAKTSVSWMGAFEKLLQAQMTDAPITPAQAEGSLRSFRAMMSNTLEKGAKGVAKNVFGYDAPGAFFSRYTGMSNLRAGEVYLPGRELDRVLGNIPGLTGKQRAAHKKRVTGGMTPEQVAAARAGSPTARAGVSSLESAYIPGFVFRQPDVSRDYGVMPAKYITAQQLAARGEDPGRVKSKFVDSGVSSLFSTIGVGDRDRDPLQGLVSIDKGGELIETKVQKQFFDAYARGNVVSASGQEVSTFDALQQVFGKQTSEYHIERSTTKDYVDVMSGEPGALSKGMAGQHLPFGEYQRAMEDWDISKENMNRTYNFMRRMESSRGGLGGAFSEKEFTENVFDPLQTMYQKAIDFSLEESPPLINALNTARVFKGADKKYRLGFNLYGDQRGTGDKFDWVSPLTAGSKGSGAVMRTLVEAIGRDKALVPDKTLGYMFAGSSEGAQRNVAALGRLEELKKSDPDKWGKVQRSSVLTGDVPVSDAGGTAIKPDISENSMLYTALWGRAAPASLGRYGNPPNEKYPEGKYTDIIADQESIMFPFKGKQTSLTDIAKDPAVLLSDIMYGYQRGTQTSRSARELTGAIGAARDIAGGPLTPEVIQRQPLAVQSFLSAAEVQLGSKKFRGMAEAPGSIDFEDKYLSVSKVRANEAFSKYMDLNLAGKPVLWASDMSAHFGKKPWNTMDKIAGGVMGLRSQTGSGLVDPKSTGSIIDKIFPVSEEKARLFKQGEEFESKWIKSIPGQGAGTEFKHSGQLRSLQYEYEGSEVHFKPDFLSWDPDNKTFNIVEHKLGKGKSAKYGGYQSAINAIGFDKLSRTPEGMEQITGYLTDIGFSNPEGIAQAIQNDPGGTIKSWMVHGAKGNDPGSGNYAYTDPVSVDWQGLEQSVIGPGTRDLVKTLGNKGTLGKVMGPVIRRAEAQGVQMGPLRSYFGMGQADPIPQTTQETPGAVPGTGATSGSPLNTSAGFINALVQGIQQGLSGGGYKGGGGGGGMLMPPAATQAQGDFVRANINEMAARSLYTNAVVGGAGQLEQAELQQQKTRAGLATKHEQAVSELGLRKLQFREEFEIEPPGTLAELGAFADAGDYDAKGFGVVSRLKKAMDAPDIALNKLREFDASRTSAPLATDAMKTHASVVGDLDKAYNKYNKTLETTTAFTKKAAEAEYDLKVSRLRAKETGIGGKIAEVLDVPFGGEGMTPEQKVTRARELRGMARTRMGALAGQTAPLTDIEQAQQAALGGLMPPADEAARITDQTVRGGVRPGKGVRLGTMARRTLGGFGLMYLSHMGTMLMGATGRGYAESLEQQAQVTAALGGAGGGMIGPQSPDEYMTRQLAAYGGGGTRAAKMGYARLLENAPGLASVLDTGKAAGIGFAGAAWIGDIAASAGILSAPAVLPVALGAAVVAGVGTAALTVYGAGEDRERTAATMAGRIAKGQYQLAPEGGLVPRRPYAIEGATTKGRLQGMFDFQLMGYHRKSDEIGPDVASVMAMRQEHKAAPALSTEEVLKGMGITDVDERARLSRIYQETRIGEYPEVSVEGLMGLAAIETSYGFQIPEYQRAQTATAIGQGVPLQPTTSAMLSATGWGAEQARAAFPTVFDSLRGLPTSKLESLTMGAQRFQTIGPLGIAPGASGLRGMFEDYAGMNERSFAALQQRNAIEQSRISLGMPFTPITPDLVSPDMTSREYADQTRLMQREQFDLQTAGGGAFAQQQQAYMPADQAAGIGRRYGLDTPGKIGAYNTYRDLYTGYGGDVSDVLGMRQVQGTPFLSEFVTAGQQFGSLATQFPARRASALAGLVEPLLAAGLPVSQMDTAVQAFGQMFSGYTDQQMGLGMQVLGGDMGAQSWASYNQQGLLGTLGKSVAESRFYNQSGRPIYETSGRDYMSLMGAHGVMPKIAGNEFFGDFMKGGLRQVQLSANAQMYENQLAGLELQGEQLGLQGWYQQRARPLQAQQRQASYSASMANFGYQRQRMEITQGFGIEQEGISWARLQLNRRTSDAQAARSEERFELGREQQLWRMDFGREGALLQRGYTQEDWQYRDEMTSMQRGWQRSDWGYQQEMQTMQRGWAREDRGFQAGTRQLQQGWAREDWGFQSQMTDLQFGWGMQDIDESIRYSHGRERRKLVEQKERMGIMYDLEGEQTEKGRGRQEEMWAREEEHINRQILHQEELWGKEDERFNIETSRQEELWKYEDEQFERTKARQEEAWSRDDTRYEKEREYLEAIMRLDKEGFDVNEARRKALLDLDEQQFDLNRRQRETLYALESGNLRRRKREYLEQYDIQEKLVKLQERYQDRQLQLSEQQLDIQESNIKTQHELQEIVRIIQQEYEDLHGKVEQISKYDNTKAILQALTDAIGEINDSSNAPSVMDRVSDAVTRIDNSHNAPAVMHAMRGALHEANGLSSYALIQLQYFLQRLNQVDWRNVAAFYPYY